MANIWTAPTGGAHGPGVFAVGSYAAAPNNPFARWNEWAIDGGIWGIREIADPPLGTASLNVLGGGFALATPDTFSGGDLAAALTQLNADFNGPIGAISAVAVATEDVGIAYINLTTPETEPGACKGFALGFGVIQNVLKQDLGPDLQPLDITPNLVDGPYVAVLMADNTLRDQMIVLLNEEIALWTP